MAKEKRGGARRNAGRKPGSGTALPHKIKLDEETVLSVTERVKLAIAGGELPVEFFLRAMRDEANSNSNSYRMEAAIAAAPYVHKKQPQDVDVTATGFPTPQPTVLIVNVGGHLSDDTRAS